MPDHAREPLRPRHLVILAILVGLWTLATAYFLNTPHHLYFDENYYAPSGNRYLRGLSDENVVHPPLGKMMIGCGIAAAETINGLAGKLLIPYPAVYRFASLGSGILILPLTFILAFKMTDDGDTALIAVLLIATDFLHIVMSKIAMLDIFLTVWTLVGWIMAWWYIRTRGSYTAALGTAIAMGAATACKWNGLLSAAGAWCAMLCLVPKTKLRTLKLTLIFMLIIPTIYLCSYTPLFTRDQSGNTWSKIYGYHTLMIRFRYNSKEFTHTYISQFWTWPLVLRPMWILFKMDKPDSSSSHNRLKTPTWVRGIIMLGSIPFWWYSLFLILKGIQTTFVTCRDRSPPLCNQVQSFLTINYLWGWLPWCAATTGGFIYYMLVLVPLMSIQVAIAIKNMYYRGKSLYAHLYLVLIATLYLMYFPFFTYQKVTPSYFHTLFFLPNWI